jgi:hypothetical protein
VENDLCRSIHDGYDLKTAALVPFAPLEDLVRQSIAKEYRVSQRDLAPFGGDPLEWARYARDRETQPGVEAFRKKYRHTTLW